MRTQLHLLHPVPSSNFQTQPVLPLAPIASFAKTLTHQSVAPEYYDIIKRPMDLKKIRARIKDGTISTIDEFERDIRLMFANATVYNTKGSQVYEFAREMMAACEGHIVHWKSMEHHLKR